MNETLKTHESLRGVNVVNDEARLSRFHIRTEEWQGCTFNLLSQQTELKRGQSALVATLTGFAALNRLDCRAGLSPLTVKSCDFSVRIWNRLSRLAMTQSVGFTMAEILLSLTIIGVVAAITLPSLMANINERTWNTQRKALYARFSQAIGMMPQIGGYGTLTEDADGNVTADTAAEAFLTEGLSKVLKINNICDSDHLADCGIPTTINALNGNVAFSQTPKTLLEFNSSFQLSKTLVNDTSGVTWDMSYSQIDTKAAAFETQNGEAVLLFYNPNCLEEIDTKLVYTQSYMCANFVYDLNGNKGPNTVGKDIGFVTALYPFDSSVVSPLPTANVVEPTDFIGARNACRGGVETRLPNIEELMAMFYNNNLLLSLDLGTSDVPEANLWSNSLDTNDQVKYLHITSGAKNIFPKTHTMSAWCIQR